MSKVKSKKQKLARVNKSLATLKEKFPELDLTDIIAYHAYMDYHKLIKEKIYLEVDIVMCKSDRVTKQCLDCNCWKSKVEY